MLFVDILKIILYIQIFYYYYYKQTISVVQFYIYVTFSIFFNIKRFVAFSG